MRKRVLLLAAVLVPLVTVQASAQEPSDLEWWPTDDRWVFVPDATNGELALFTDTTSVRVHDGYVRTWVLTGRSQVKTSRALHWDSSVTLYEHDCAEGRSRILQISYRLGKEVVRRSQGPTQWIYETPGSIGEILADHICGLP